MWGQVDHSWSLGMKQHFDTSVCANELNEQKQELFLVIMRYHCASKMTNNCQRTDITHFED